MVYSFARPQLIFTVSFSLGKLVFKCVVHWSFGVRRETLPVRIQLEAAYERRNKLMNSRLHRVDVWDLSRWVC